MFNKLKFLFIVVLFMFLPVAVASAQVITMPTKFASKVFMINGDTVQAAIDEVNEILETLDINYATKVYVNGTDENIINNLLPLKADKTYVNDNFATTDEVRHATNTYYVDNTRLDAYTENGNINYPFKTIQAALTKVTADNGVVLRHQVIVSAGLYTEALDVTNDNYLLIDLNAAQITGNFTWHVTSASTTYKPKLVFRGSDLRSAYPNFHYSGILGNITVDQTSVTPSKYSGLHFINSGVNGNISVIDGVLTHVFLTNSFYTGDITTSGTAVVYLYADNSNSSGSYAVGGAVGNVAFNRLNNVNLTRKWDLSGYTYGSGGGDFHNVSFGTGKAHNLSGYKGTLKMDLTSYNSFLTGVTTFPAAYTINLSDTVSGTTAARPTPNSGAKGFAYFDTTISKPVFWNGTAWVDVTEGLATTAYVNATDEAILAKIPEIRTGRAEFNSVAGRAVVFATPMPDASYQISIMPEDDTIYDIGDWSFRNKTADGFTLYNSGENTAAYFDYTAIRK